MFRGNHDKSIECRHMTEFQGRVPSAIGDKDGKHQTLRRDWNCITKKISKEYVITVLKTDNLFIETVFTQKFAIENILKYLFNLVWKLFYTL